VSGDFERIVSTSILRALIDQKRPAMIIEELVMTYLRGNTPNSGGYRLEMR
jgi:hypothetical protein